MKELPKRLFEEEALYAWLEEYAAGHGKKQMQKALPFARAAHAGQLRDNSVNIPYIVHPMQITKHAIVLGLTDDALLATALLHDVCEDCGILYEELPAGEKVREAVRLLTKEWERDLGEDPESDAKEEAYYKAISENRIASMVKLLDRCNNISSMADAFSKKRMEQYLSETVRFYKPLIREMEVRFPEYEAQIFAVSYQIYAVVSSLERMIKESRDDEKITRG